MLIHKFERADAPAPKRHLFTISSRFIMIISAIFLMVGLSACGEEPNNSRPVFNNTQGGDTDKKDVGNDDVDTNDGGKNDIDDLLDVPKDDIDTNTNTDTETEDQDTLPDDDTTVPPDSKCDSNCHSSKVCVDGKCVLDTAARKCGDATDLGKLKIGVKKTAEGTLFRTSNVISTSCGPDDDILPIGAEAVFKFTVEQDSRIDFKAKWLGQFDGLIAFHTDSCEIPGSTMDSCFDHEQQSFYALAGHDYFMIVELNHGRSDDFTVELTAKTIECIPGPNSNTCVDGSFNRCEGVGVIAEYNCAAGCTGANTQCLGNSCDEPIIVTASTTFTGKNQAYNDQYDFQYINGCEVDGHEIPTPGPEIIFMLPNLTQGQVVIVDAQTNDLNSNAIFITSNCGLPSKINCLATAYDDEILTWTAPADGDYFVFIEKETGSGDNFHYSIDIR